MHTANKVGGITDVFHTFMFTVWLRTSMHTANKVGGITDVFHTFMFNV